MEFAIFIQGYMPGLQAHDRAREHQVLMEEIELVKSADANNFKFVWLSEHHALPEYSHLSANETVAGYLAAVTDRIHIGTGIFNVSPRVNHPVRRAEQVAMLDHLSNRRFEFGMGRGAGSHEVGTFNIHDTSSTRAEFDDVVREFVRMWERNDYTYQGTHFQVDNPHNILPKPYLPGHPPMWVACGNPQTFDKAGQLGLGALGFTFDSIEETRERFGAYKDGIEKCTDPVGQFVNNNIMVTTIVRIAEDRDRARDQVLHHGAGYVATLVSLYHDTFPHGEALKVKWPNPPGQMTEETLDMLIERGFLLCGTPEEVCEQFAKRDWHHIDQVCFATAVEASFEERIEMIELFGKHVVPEFDKDPVISTDRYRAEAQPKFGTYNNPPPPLQTVWSETGGFAPY